MNTRKVFFGLLGVAFLAMAAVSTDVFSDDNLEGKTEVDRKKIERV